MWVVTAALRVAISGLRLQRPDVVSRSGIPPGPRAGSFLFRSRRHSAQTVVHDSEGEGRIIRVAPRRQLIQRIATIIPGAPVRVDHLGLEAPQVVGRLV